MRGVINLPRGEENVLSGPKRAMNVNRLRAMTNQNATMKNVWNQGHQTAKGQNAPTIKKKIQDLLIMTATNVPMVQGQRENVAGTATGTNVRTVPGPMAKGQKVMQ